MDQNFFFVDGLHADKVSKKLMRRHVMRGKNTGKTIHRPSRNNQIIQNRPMERIARPVGTPFFTFPFPVPVTKTASKAIDDFFNLTVDLIYPSQLGFDLENDKRKWLEIMFRGKSDYECSLALIQVSNETYLGAGCSCSNTLSCLSQALQQLKERLGSKEALSDHTLTIVTALINHEQSIGHFAAAEAHMAGLKRMVDLRGGLDNIQDLAIVTKACRTDILFAMQQGGHATFHRDRMTQLRRGLLSRSFTLEPGSDSYFMLENRLKSPLKEVLRDTLGVCRLFNENLHDKPLDLIEFQEALMSICYRLLQFRTLNESRLKHHTQSAYHIASMIFIMSVYWHNYQSRLAKPGLIAACVREVLDMIGHENEFSLWLLVLGGLSVSEKDGQEWMVSRLRERASVLGVSTWDEARRYLVRFPWMNAIHDEPGQRLWDRIRLRDL